MTVWIVLGRREAEVSVCIECGREMDWAEAEEWYVCERCRSQVILSGEEMRVPTQGSPVRGCRGRKRRRDFGRIRDEELGAMWLRQRVEGVDELEFLDELGERLAEEEGWPCGL
jgi:DNA-directed RNA polymerase subunit RPC12/RpoP